MQFEADAFISYAHLDNVELVEGRRGWVANLQRALAVRVAQMLGKESRIWWDKKLRGNDDFDDTLIARLQRVALLVAVVSPRYVRSEWGRKEILAFCEAAHQQGGLEIQDKCRLFKVLKTQVPLDQHPPELQAVLGYEFYKIDPETGKPRELNEIFGPEAERDFWIKLDDLAHDMCNLLQLLERGMRAAEAAEGAAASAPAPLGSVYLAVTTTDAKDERAAIKRELEQQGYRVLPDRPLPLTEAEVEAAVTADLAQCRMSIHIVGGTYGVIPEGGTASLCEIQNDLAIARGRTGDFSRLVWIQPGLQVDDERQRQAIERLRNDPRIIGGADVLETPFEDLRTLVIERLRRDESAGAEPADSSEGPPHVYLIHDQRDTQAVAPWADFLFNEFEVIRPGFDGDEADTRAYHEENLRLADGVVIFYGAGNESWLRRKLREVQKSAGYGRSKPEPEIGICLIAPRTPEKEQFRTHKGMLLPQWDGVTPDAWRPFVDRLKGGRTRRLDHAADRPA